MMTQISKRQIRWALAACVAGIIALSQLSDPGRALSMSTPTTTAATGDASAPGFETDIPDRGAALLLACRQDARQLCANVVPGQGRVVRCLAERRNELSEYCQSTMVQRRLNHERLRRTAQDWLRLTAARTTTERWIIRRATRADVLTPTPAESPPTDPARRP